MSNDTLIDAPDKVQLGMGELFAILQTGTNTPTEGQDWSFLEVQPDTVISSMTFKVAKTDEEIVVTRYNVTYTGVCLIPPVYQGKQGDWVSVTCVGQIYAYGRYAVG